MKLRLPSLLITLISALLAGLLPPSASAADRNIDTNIVYPAPALVQNGGRVINLRTPPSGITPAVGDGTTDDTASFQDAYDFIKNAFVSAQAAGQNPLPSYIIYVPNGTYRVTSTIIYRGTTDAAMNGIRFIGQSRAGTLVKLDSFLPAFQSPTAPASVLAYQFPVPLSGAASNPPSKSNNIATSNQCENLTINTGSGNPGAAGIYFQGANSARMSNVTVTAGDGNGYCGVWLETGSVQAYLKDITINGYNYAISSIANGENDTAWEHVSINNPTVAAIYMHGGGLSMRDLDLSQATLHVPAVQYANTGSSVVLLDSHLNGGSSGSAAIILVDSLGREDLVIRNVFTSGYAVDVQDRGTATVTGPYISEYVRYPVVTLFPVPDQHTFALPVQDTPNAFYDANFNNWVNANDYGAKGDGTTDDTTAIQAAFNAAATYNRAIVYFPSLHYKVTKTITIPIQVQRVDFMFCNIDGGIFSVNAATSHPLSLLNSGSGIGFNLNAARTVAMELCAGGINNQQTAPVTTFIESCTNCGAGGQFCTAGQTVWARSINSELSNGISDIQCNGGLLWIMGYKTENKASIPIDSEHGYTEVLGGYINTTEPTYATGASVATYAPEMLRNNNASLCYTGFTNYNGKTKIPTAISETQNGTTMTAASSNSSLFPARGGGYSADILIPLYIGGARPATAFGTTNLAFGNQDIGSVGAVGSASSYSTLHYPAGVTPGTYFVDGSGADIGGSTDAFQFAEENVTGNMTLIAKVDAIDNTNQWAKAGVMFRATTDANSAFAAIVMTPGHGAFFEYRTAASAASTGTVSPTALTAPYWVKLARTSTSDFTASTSPDGITWTTLGTATVDLPATVLGGLAVTSHSAGVVARAIFEGVSLTVTPAQ